MKLVDILTEDPRVTYPGQRFRKQYSWSRDQQTIPLTSDERVAQQSRKQEEEAVKKAKWDNGEPAQVELNVIAGRDIATGQPKMVKRTFTIDNLLSVRHALQDFTIKDLGQVERDPAKRSATPTYAAVINGKTTEGSIPNLLFGIKKHTRRKPGYPPEDLRREAYAE